MGIHAILTNLIYRHHYFLSIKICQYLSLSPDFILVHWACEKIKNSLSLSDEAIRDQIRENLKLYSSISYRDIARVAYEEDRKHLATMLLEFEPCRADRVSCCSAW